MSNGQRWPLRMCAKREGTHVEVWLRSCYIQQEQPEEIRHIHAQMTQERTTGQYSPITITSVRKAGPHPRGTEAESYFTRPTRPRPSESPFYALLGEVRRIEMSSTATGRKRNGLNDQRWQLPMCEKRDSRSLLHTTRPLFKVHPFMYSGKVRRIHAQPDEESPVNDQ